MSAGRVGQRSKVAAPCDIGPNGGIARDEVVTALMGYPHGIDDAIGQPVHTRV